MIMHLKVLNNIHQTDPDKWNVLAGNRILSTYGWLKTAEETLAGGTRPIYLLAGDNGKPEAASVCYIQPRKCFGGNLDHLLFGRLFRLASAARISALPALVCGPLFGCGDHFLFEKNLTSARRKEIAEGLLTAIETEASKNNLPVAFTNVSDGDPDLPGLLHGRGYLKSGLAPLAYLDIRFSSFDAYLDHLKRRSPSAAKSARHEINRNRALGTVISDLKTPGAETNRLFRLLARNYLIHNRIPFMFRDNFLSRLAANLGKDAIFYVASGKTRSHGICLLFRKGRIGHVLFAGIDHRMAGNDFTYFNLCYYRPIRDAIGNGTERLYFGTGLYRLKKRRGCEMLPVSLYYRPRSRLAAFMLRFWFRLLTERIKRLR